jgi:iron complex outermembrane receptor protein
MFEIRMKVIKTILILLLSSGWLTLWSQEKTSVLNDTITEKIEEVTVTAFRSPYNLFTIPAPVSVVASSQLETGSSLTPIEALNQVSGILMHNGTLNTNRLTIRGIGARTPYSTNKIKAYYGEIPLTSGDGETTLEDLENASISRIEIVKGPSSSLFGAGLAGVVLFFPESVENSFVQNQTIAGSFGIIKNTLSAGLNDKNLNVFALGSVLHSDGYRENNETNRTNLLLNSTWNISSNTELQVLLKGTKMDAFIPSSLNREMYEETPWKAAPTWMNAKGNEIYTGGQAGVTLNFALPGFQRISASTFGSFRNGDELRPFNTLIENSAFYGWRAYYQKQITSEKNKFTISTGVEVFREKYDWSTLTNNGNALLSDNEENRQYENLFVQLEAFFSEKISISAGLNGNLTRFYYKDLFTENGNQSGEQHYKPTLSPRLGINYLINRNISVFGNISHGFSTPTFEETLYPQGEINPDIIPETGWSAEAGFRSQWANRVQFSASYYRIYIENLLVARRTGDDEYVGVNAGKSEHPGFETEISWLITRPEKYPSVQLAGTATFANYHFTDFTDSGIDYSGNNLAGTAKNTWFVRALIKITRNLDLTFWHRFTGEMPVNDSNSEYSDAFGISNAEIKYSPHANRFSFELKAGIQNIFDVKYASMLAVNALPSGNSTPRYYYPGNPRNYFVSISIRFE